MYASNCWYCCCCRCREGQWEWNLMRMRSQISTYHILPLLAANQRFKLAKFVMFVCSLYFMSEHQLVEKILFDHLAHDRFWKEKLYILFWMSNYANLHVPETINFLKNVQHRWLEFRLRLFCIRRSSPWVSQIYSTCVA